MNPKGHDQFGKARRIYTSMVADLFHYGHVEFLRRAKSLGDYLIVGLLTDERVATYKRAPILSWEERKRVLISCRYVDEVWPQSGRSPDTEFMTRHDLALQAYAATNEKENQRFLADCLPELDQKYLLRIDYTDAISTTMIVKRILERQQSTEMPLEV